MTPDEVKQELIKVMVSQKEYKLSSEVADKFSVIIASSKLDEIKDFNAQKKLKTYEAEREQHLRNMLYFRERAECMISLLDLVSEREVITHRYLLGESWEKISETLNYAERSVHYIHNKALNKISDKLR